MIRFKSINWKYFFITFILLTLFSIQAPLGITIFPIFIIFVLPLLILYWLTYARTGERRNKKSYKIIVTSIFVILVSFIVSISIIRWQSVKSKEEGNKIVNALESYKTKYNKYPGNLNELNPQYLQNIPCSSMGYGNVEYKYIIKPGGKSYYLSFPNAAIFNTVYNSSVKEWRTE